jgi:hypothetical protein
MTLWKKLLLLLMPADGRKSSDVRVVVAQQPIDDDIAASDNHLRDIRDKMIYRLGKIKVKGTWDTDTLQPQETLTLIEQLIDAKIERALLDLRMYDDSDTVFLGYKRWSLRGGGA